MPTIPASDSPSKAATMAPAVPWLLASVLFSTLMAPGVAAAQDEQDPVGALGFARAEAVEPPAIVNIDACGENATLVFRWELDAIPAEDQRVRISTNTRQDCAAATEVVVVVAERQTNGNATGTVEVDAQQILPDCPAIEQETRYVCLELPGTAARTDAPFNPAGIEVRIDTIAPEPPDRLSAAPGDGALHVSWNWSESVPGDLESVRVFHRRAETTDDPVRTDVTGRTVRSARVSGLQNGVEYEVWVQPVDDAANEGEASESVLGTPEPTLGFWDLYRDRGGAETGGCASGGGLGPAALLLVGIAGLAAASRRRRLAVTTATRGRRLRRAGTGLLALVAVGASALAIPGEAAATERSGWVEPDRKWFLEVDLGPYRPEIDREFEGTGPYEEIFGGGNELLVRLRAERAIWQGIGQVGAGLSAGFAQTVGRARFADGSPSPEATVFSWVPLQLSLTYRFDYTALEWGIPLVPYARTGLAYTLWWITGPEGIARDDEGNSARGGRLGFFYGGGLKFLLNVLDPRLAADFRRSAGVDHTYLYAELVRMQVDGFGSSGFNLSDTTWFAGLAIEF